MKERYADTIRKKVDAGRNPASKPKQPLFRMNRLNRWFWPLLLFPAFTLVYTPINHYIALPLFGSGRPHINAFNELVYPVFSANALARILFWLIFSVTELLLIRISLRLDLKKRIAYLIGCTLMCILMGIVFLEYTLWE